MSKPFCGSYNKSSWKKHNQWKQLCGYDSVIYHKHLASWWQPKNPSVASQSQFLSPKLELGSEQNCRSQFSKLPLKPAGDYTPSKWDSSRDDFARELFEEKLGLSVCYWNSRLFMFYFFKTKLWCVKVPLSKLKLIVFRLDDRARFTLVEATYTLWIISFLYCRKRGTMHFPNFSFHFCSVLAHRHPSTD